MTARPWHNPEVQMTGLSLKKPQIVWLRMPGVPRQFCDELIKSAGLREFADLREAPPEGEAPEIVKQLASSDVVLLFVHPNALKVNLAMPPTSQGELGVILVATNDGKEFLALRWPYTDKQVNSTDAKRFHKFLVNNLDEIQSGSRARAGAAAQQIQQWIFHNFDALVQNDSAADGASNPTSNALDSEFHASDSNAAASPRADAPPRSDDDAGPEYSEDDESGGAPARFDTLRREEFNAGAWAILELARRLGAGRDRPRTSVRRVLASFMLSGLDNQDDESDLWLIRRIPQTREREDILNRLSSQYRVIDQYRNRSPWELLRSDEPASETMTPNLMRVIETARRLAFESQRADSKSQVHKRHLLGAAFKREGERTNAQRFLSGFGLNSNELRQAILQELPRWGVPDDPSVWRRILEPPAVLVDDGYRLPRYESDATTGRDLLDIRREVEAMASLLSAWSIEPPLSIGLFGEWGSGKSFFMKKVQERVRQIAEAARNSAACQKDFGYYKNIVQVEFNAWHYVEGNLWASLVEHIFENLRVMEDDKPNEVAERRAKLLKQMQIEVTKREEATTNLQDLEKQAKEAGTKAKDARDAADKAVNEKRNITSADIIHSVRDSKELKDRIVYGLRVLGLPDRELTSVAELRSAIADATDVATVIGNGFTILKEQKQWKLMLGWALGVPAVGFTLAWGLHALNDGTLAVAGQTLIAGLSPILGLAAATASAWRSVRPRLEPLLKTVEDLKSKRDELDRRAEVARHERADQVAKLEKAADEKRQEAAKAEREQEAAEAAINKLNAQIDDLEPGRMIARFIQDRAGADDYRKFLGVPALIRRDFEKLSAMFRSQRNEEAAGKDGLGIPGRNDTTIVNRIILYIDDLDRCAPEKVVEVLRIIHLLLAFPLFVVVVAVDARWMKRSLKERYPLMLSDVAASHKGEAVRGQAENVANDLTVGVTATPDDYLEKIFQVPFWIRPLEPAACGEFVRRLTANDVESPIVPLKSDQDRSAPGPVVPLPSDVRNKRPIEEKGVKPPQDLGSKDETIRNSSRLTPPPPPHTDTEAAKYWTKVESNPRALYLTQEEREYMVSLAPVIGRSPRAVKRFVNCYRLLKSASDPVELDRASQKGTFRMTMLLLGIVTGFPEASALFDDLRRAHPEKAAALWGREVTEKQIVEQSDKWKLITSLIEQFPNAGVTTGTFAEGAMLVDRFSFSPIRCVARAPTAPPQAASHKERSRRASRPTRVR
jgi:seryl-tRNA synthetase